MRELMSAFTGLSTADLPLIMLWKPQLGSAQEKKKYEEYLRRKEEKYPLPLSEPTSQLSAVIPVELASLSLQSVKAYA